MKHTTSQTIKKRIIPLIIFTLSSALTLAAEPEEADSLDVNDLDELVVTTRMRSTRKLKGLVTNTDLISAAELCRAACCNLGESFTTNPSVDVSYSDAASGSKQIKLLGLSGTYVQMLTENFPNLRGASAPWALNYIPGPWMQSIQVSKGASSVKNGYESVTGQINVEMLKPQSDNSLLVNGFANHQGKLEGNFAGNVHLSPKWSTGLLLHAENTFDNHDGNHDGFTDMPDVRQFSGMNRWAYMGDKYVFQAGVKFLDERRRSGQIGHAAHVADDTPYIIDITTHRWEAFTKNAYIFDRENDGNVALILSGSSHDMNSGYGHRMYDVRQLNGYASLMFERKLGEFHSISTGLSLNYDEYKEHYRLALNQDVPPGYSRDREAVGGVYAQYTFNYDARWLAMVGLRYDRSNVYGNMFTPRVHLKWNGPDAISAHASAGRGYRSPHALADFSYLLASSRQLIIDNNLRQEEGWNYGGGFNGNIPLGSRKLGWSAEYYYTHFKHQTVVDLDFNPSQAWVKNVQGRSYSHAAQAELTCEVIPELTLTAAYRYTDVKLDYGRGLVSKPLTSRSKGLFTAAWAPQMGLWQIDATFMLTGGGRMPTPATVDGIALWQARYHTFPTLNAQVTRNFRHWAVYIGGENLTGYRQKNPIIGAADPWGSHFDATMVYGPVEGAMVYAGFRYTLNNN